MAALAGLSDDSDIDPSSIGTPAMSSTQASRLLQYFVQRNAQEDSSALSQESEVRMLNKLRASGISSTKSLPATQTPTRGFSIGDWINRLFQPSGTGFGSRYAVVAGIALIALAVPIALQHLQTPLPETPKTGPDLGANVQLKLVSDPRQHMQQLKTALEAVGVTVQVRDHQQGFLLEAQVAPEQRSAVMNALQPFGLVLPKQGPLMVSIQPT
ncbi:hypothetical protein G7048_23655 [Diaphorobacter sp. HDW4B]|uniref:hypothetical protein n=1 Tax=Diaphorobacter sp. HDW4B TaxID=2714925 RepID=UPI00140A6CC0|nr:hypothetical protein [Diaphorobacter sp. HDW4B]QIL73084.1 hypothetical protein G7048_23655 [Diaphorobacter sp. HDW4B]